MPRGIADESSPAAPLATRMRPRTLDEFLGQRHLLGPGRILREMIERDELQSLILWGPPGSGKTSLARIIADRTNAAFLPFSAVTEGVARVRAVIAEANERLVATGRRTILFCDEIHRFNRAQQDAFLPHVEAGTIILIGATTENPSFEVNSALLSRSRVLVLEPLEETHLLAILKRALEDAEQGYGDLRIEAEPDALRQIALFSGGDARRALNALEAAVQLGSAEQSDGPLSLTTALVREALQKRTLLYDKAGEEHFNLISALHKSLRNSDVDASLYWLARMLESGEDPLYIARRLVRFASEDVGLADPGALGKALDAMRAVDFIGLPEGKLALAQATVYLAQAPKSNAVYRAYGAVAEAVAECPHEPVPLQLRNAPTALMKGLGYGRGYLYAHDQELGTADLDCLPDSLVGRRFYHPSEEGFEGRVARRLEEWRRRRTRAATESNEDES